MSMRYEPYAFRDFKENKRYTLLTILLINLSKDLIDKAFEVHDRQMLTLISKGRKAQEEIQKNNGKKLNEKIVLIVTLIGMGTNIGLTKMSDAASGISYKQMAYISQWRMHEDALNRAQANLVNFHTKLNISKY